MADAKDQNDQAVVFDLTLPMPDISPRRRSGLWLLLNLTRRNRTVIFTVTSKAGASTRPGPFYRCVDSLAMPTNAGLFLVFAYSGCILAQRSALPERFRE
jgi:hypothetical protein